MKGLIKQLLREAVENSDKYEYQIRYIDGPNFYKRKCGEDTWSFINAEDFANEAPGNELIKWDKDK